jgi:hypothetical protein
MAFLTGWFTILALLALLGVGLSQPDFYNVAVMFPILTSDNKPHIQGNMDAAAIFLAFDAINNKTDGIADDLLPGVELRMVVRSPLGSFSRGAETAVDVIDSRGDDGVLACVGPYGLLPTQG